MWSAGLCRVLRPKCLLCKVFGAGLLGIIIVLRVTATRGSGAVCFQPDFWISVSIESSLSGVRNLPLETVGGALAERMASFSTGLTRR